ncbi:MAG: RHS repeat-associated core domain-containing protein [Bacteroidota bacterium]
MESWVNDSYMNQGREVDGSTPGVNLNMWQIAYGIVMCRQTNEGPDRKACMNLAPELPYTSLSTAQRDAIWEQFKRLYISERDQHVNAFIAEVKPIADDDALIAGGYKLHFPKSNFQLASQINEVDGEGGMSWYPQTITADGAKPININVQDAEKEYFTAGCESYIASWRKSLLQCNALAGKSETVREQILAEITTRMLAICKLGANAANPLGSSTVPPSTPSSVSDRTFEDVVNDVFQANQISKDYYCNPYVIEAPKPYGLNRKMSSEFIAVLDTCACNQLTKIKTEAAAFLQTPITSIQQLNSYLLTTYNDTIATALYQAMSSKCSGLWGEVCPPVNSENVSQMAVSEGCRDTAFMYPLSAPHALPSFLKCGFEGSKRCYSCGDLRTLTADFKIAFPASPFNNAPVFLATNTLSEENILQNQLFARYLNFKTGMQYSWADYANAAATTCRLDSGTANNNSIVICRNDKALNDTTGLFVKESRCQMAYIQAFDKASIIYEARVKELALSFDEPYRAKCLAAGAEQFTVSYTNSEYHYTLYYYDQAGSLVQTVPPAGVRPDFSSSFLAQVNADRPIGVRKAPNHVLLTRYLYNSLNQVVRQKTPDGGESRFWYDYLGRLVVSQNAKQKGTHDFADAGGSFSYTLYDQLGRITEVGQKDNASPITQQNAQVAANFGNWLSSGSNVQITKTIYDTGNPAWILLGSPPRDFSAQNLRNRVAYTLVQKTENDPGEEYITGTFYSYDIHGNVDVLLQDYANGIMESNGSGNRWKILAYKYDLISGKVNEVAYQEGLADAFYHRYDYDAENRLTRVESSRDRILWEEDARYSYYRHGPLARTELGALKVQGIDYAYTLQGWLKSINPSTTPHTGGDCPPGANSPDLFLDDRLDPAQYPIGTLPPQYIASNSINFLENFTSLEDEHFETIFGVSDIDCNTDPIAIDLYDEDGNPGGLSPTGRDAYKLNLHYYQGDYTPIALPDFEGNTGLSELEGRHDLFNGNISAMAVNIRKLAALASSPGANYAGALLYNYRYDQLNRITSMDAFATNGSFLPKTPHSPIPDYKERYSYDPNGNILGLERNGTASPYKNHSGSTVSMDNLTYQYERDPISGDLSSNRLRYVFDAINSEYYTEDIDNQTTFNSAGQVENDRNASQVLDNYQYDEIGNLIHDEKENLEEITWTVYGKIERIIIVDPVTKNEKTKIEYTYDASGNRISKTVTPISSIDGSAITTWYVRDAQGNVMSTYVTGDESKNNGALTQTELHLYGSSRLGVLNCSLNCSGTGLNLPEKRTFTRGEKFFELSNHLGNVLATITDRLIQMSAEMGLVSYYLPDVATASDYYPFGMQMPGRSSSSESYRYGFNGKENDIEIKGAGNQQDYGMRIYDPRLGRFLSVDPLTSKYAMLTPYQFASNRPIDGIDLDGLEFFKKDNTNYRMTYQPVMNANGVYKGTKNVAHNTISFVWNGTLGALFEGTKSVNNYFAGGYKEPTQSPLASFKNSSDQALEYHRQTPLKQQVKDFGEAATNLENYEVLPSLLIAHTLSIPRVNVAGITEKSTINLRVRLNSAEAVNKTFISNGYYAPYAAGTTLGEFEITSKLNNIVRLSGAKNIQGGWFTTMHEIKGLTPAQMKDKFSLKYEPTQMTPVTLTEGSTLRVGTAAPVSAFNANGGGFQIELLKGQAEYGKSVSLKN